MDRQGYEGDTYGAGTGTGTQKPLTERVKEAIPGTDAYEATHGMTGAHRTAEQAKAYIPGTEEHRMQQLGVTGGHHTTTTGGATGYTGSGRGTGHTGPTMTERVKEAIPGTNEYEATHGMTGAHRTVEQAKAYVSGTEEHRIHEATRPAGSYSTHTGTHAAQTGTYDTSSDTYGTGSGGGVMGHTGMGGTGMGGTTGVAGEHKPLGQKIKEALPGTREHEAKKAAEGRF